MRQRGKSRIALITLTLGLILSSGCGGGESRDAPALVTRAELTGRSFVAQEVTGRDLVPGSRLEIDFDQENVAAFADCNRIFGPYRIEDGRLRVKGPASTMMACEPELMNQDQWLAEFLASGPEIRLSGEELTLSGGEPEVSLTLREQ